MANLRDKGYPSSASVKRDAGKQPRVARQLSGTATGFQKREIPEGTEQWYQSRPRAESQQLVDDKAEVYANALNSLLQKSGTGLTANGSTTFYKPDYNWGKWTNADINVRTPNDNRLAYAHKTHNYNPANNDMVTAGVDVDNFISALDDVDIYNERQLPLGINAFGGVESGTVYGGLEYPQAKYYLAALANLLRR